MGLIKKLPTYLINILKAGEIVERPASVVKELIENSLDAGANEILLEIKDGGKKLIKVEDNGIGISYDDLPLTIERYATSKIFSEDDLKKILTYGFRGEALAAIGEVSKLKIISKTKDQDIAYILEKVSENVKIEPISFSKENGTIVYVEDIFYNVPVRKKYLKSSKTEEKYIIDTFLNFSIINYNINLKFIKEGKLIYNFKSTDSILQRISDIYPKNYINHFKIVENIDKNYKVYGVVSDANLTFLTPDNIKIFVNKRPVVDKIIKKAILDAYYRQLPSSEYPFAILFLEISPDILDVNVHPRKLEVKFFDPGSVYNFVKKSLEKVFEEEKISVSNFSNKKIDNLLDFSFGNGVKSKLDINFTDTVFTSSKGFDINNEKFIHLEKKEDNKSSVFKIIGQLWDSYIVLQDDENLYIVDQHALAERIKFERLKTKYLNDKDISLLLTPAKIEIGKDISNIQEKLEKINILGFDISLFGEDKVIIYGIPKVFEQYKVDINKLILNLLYLSVDEISLEKILDKIWETKACKLSIKAGEKLSYEEMKNLIEEGFEYIKGQFVCQHGRPSFVKISKQEIEKMFDR